MMQVLEFTFQNFWHFIGMLMLCLVVFGGIGATLRALRDL